MLMMTAACTPDSGGAGSKAAEADAAKDSEMTTNLIERASNQNFADTVAALRAGIESRPLKLFAEIDHAAGAASIDMELPPSTLFIFGNPKGGTPLMTQNPRMGIVLPLKMHVYETDGKVMISYPDMEKLAQAHGLDPAAQPIPNITGLLDGLAGEAAR